MSQSEGFDIMCLGADMPDLELSELPCRRGLDQMGS